MGTMRESQSIGAAPYVGNGLGKVEGTSEGVSKITHSIVKYIRCASKSHIFIKIL